MSVYTSQAVFTFLDRVRQNPAAAVAPEELATLERAAREDLEGTRIALTAPVADRTLLSRKLLTTAADSISDEFSDLGEPLKIVGFFPSLLAIEAGKTLPPLNAIDVKITIGRSRKEVYNDARNNAQAPAPLTSQTEFTTLAGISSEIANRLMDFDLYNSPYAIAFEYQWAVDSATRTALGWSNVMISLDCFVKLRFKNNGDNGG